MSIGKSHADVRSTDITSLVCLHRFSKTNDVYHMKTGQSVFRVISQGSSQYVHWLAFLIVN